MFVLLFDRIYFDEELLIVLGRMVNQEQIAVDDVGKVVLVDDKLLAAEFLVMNP